MSVSDKTRKLLWGRSGNRCVICKHELVIDATLGDDESVIGEECHIVSSRVGGPRYTPVFRENEIDSYDNLILLCRSHHKMVDDQCETYTSDVLHLVKANHEKWVKDKLNDTPEPKPLRFKRLKDKIPPYLVRLTTGKEVLSIVEGACASSFDHDELESQHEVDLVGAFLSIAKDWGDIGLDLEPNDKVHTAFRLTALLKELEEVGFFVFGGREIQLMEGGYSETPSDWPIAILHVLRKTNGSIIAVNLEEQEKIARESDSAKRGNLIKNLSPNLRVGKTK